MGWKYTSAANNAWAYVSAANNAWKYISTEVDLDLCAEYQVVYDAMTNKPSSTVITAQDTMVETLVAYSIWSELDVFQMYANEVNTDGEAQINWINPGSSDASLIASPIFTSLEGFTGNATDMVVDSGYNPTADGTNYLQDDACVGIYMRSAGNSPTTRAHLGATTSRFAQIYGKYTLFNSGYESNNNVLLAAEYVGMITMDRVASNQAKIYRNGVEKLVMSETSNGIPTVNFRVLCRNNGGSSANFSDSQIALFFAGGSLTENQHLNLFAAVETYLASV